MTEKIVLITGAGQGIGKAYARRVAKSGSHVLPADVNEERVTEAAAGLASAGLSTAPEVVDVADERSCAALADRVKSTHAQAHGGP